MATRNRAHTSSSDESPTPTSLRGTPKATPKTPVSKSRGKTLSTPLLTPSSTTKMYTSTYKEKIDYSNSKEIHNHILLLDNVIAKRKQELSSIQRSSAISGGHRRKFARTTGSPIKTARNLDKDLSLVDEKSLAETTTVTATNGIEAISVLNESAIEPSVSKIDTEDIGNDADNSDHESISSISSKGSGALSVMEIPAVLSSVAGSATSNIPVIAAVSTSHMTGSPIQRSGSNSKSVSPSLNFSTTNNDSQYSPHFSAIVINESFEGDTSHQADTQDSTPDASALQVAQEALDSPPKRYPADTNTNNHNVEPISLPNSMLQSSIMSDPVDSEDDVCPSNAVAPSPNYVSNYDYNKHINNEASNTDNNDPSIHNQTDDIVPRSNVALVNIDESAISQSHEDEEEMACNSDFMTASLVEEESDLPDNSRTVHPETYTVDNIQDQMDIEHATVQFGHSRYSNIHLRIDSVADLGDNNQRKYPMLLANAENEGPDNNFGIAMEEVAEIETDSREKSTVEDNEEDEEEAAIVLASTTTKSNNTSHVLNDISNTSSTGSKTSFSSSSSVHSSASKARGAHQGVEEKFLLGKSMDASSLLSTPPSLNNTSRSANSGDSKKPPPHSASSHQKSNSNIDNRNMKQNLENHNDSDIYMNEHHLFEGDLDSSSYLHQSFNTSKNNNNTSNISGLDSSLLNSGRKASFLESEAKLLKRHLSVYQLKNALLKEEVVQITKMSEEKFQEVLQHMHRLEQERDKAKKDRVLAQEELLAEQEELMFVRGQLQGKSARVIDLEAELLAVQRLLAALQKEAKVWRTSTTPTPASGNTPTNVDKDKSTSGGKRVHFHFPSPQDGLFAPDQFASMEPMQAILFVLDQLEASHPEEKEKLQNYLRESQREKILLESQVSDLDQKLHTAEAESASWQKKAEELDTAELEVGRLVLETESLQAQLLEALQERDALLVEVQHLKEDLSAKDQALLELEQKHQAFMIDYVQIQDLLTEIQTSLAAKDIELAAAKEHASALSQDKHTDHVTTSTAQVTIIAKEHDGVMISSSNNNINAKGPVVAGPTMRQVYNKPSVYIVKSTGYTGTLCIMLVLQLIVLGLLLMYLQVNFQMIMLTDNEDIIERLLKFRSAY